MDRVAVFIDAGYLFAAAGQLLTGRRTTRSELYIDVDAAEEQFRLFAEGVTGLQLLRIYWYDGTSAGPTNDHLRLMRAQNIKVRLGIVNTYGEQKGVDSLVVSDMINLARSGNVASAILLTGDEDLRVGVQQAQAAGLRVHLLGVVPTRENQSDMLQQEADVTHAWGVPELGEFLSVRGPIAHVVVALPESASRDDIVHAVVLAVVDSLDDDQRSYLRAEYQAGQQRVPRELDRILIKTLRDYLEVVEEEDKWAMRQHFFECV